MAGSCRVERRQRRAGVCLAASLLVLASAACVADKPAPTSALQPYQASYTTRIKGITVNLQRQLSAQSGDQWQLSQQAKLLFSRISEQSLLQQRQEQITPLRFRYSNSISSSRDQEIIFDWRNAQLHMNKQTQPLNAPVLDRLSFQLQLRDDLLNGRLKLNAGEVASKIYLVADNGKIRHYRIQFLGQQWLDTALGRLRSHQFAQWRESRADKQTLIWLASDWDYLLLRLQRVENDEASEVVEIQSAEIGGSPVRAPQPQ